jgi:hypothetical protein
VGDVIEQPTQTNRRPTAWLKAVPLVALDEQSDEAIASGLGITTRTLRNWKRQSAFEEQVQALREEFAAIARREAIMTVEGRVAEYALRHERMHSVIEKRAAAGGDAPGADTGLLVKSFKAIGSGESAYAAVEWSVDTGLLREMRELEKQAAQDLGQWAEKKEHSGPNGGPIPIQAIEVVLQNEVTAEVTVEVVEGEA